MSNLELVDYIDNEIKRTWGQGLDTKFEDFDIRRDYYYYQLDILRNFQRGVFIFDLSKLIHEMQPFPLADNLSLYKNIKEVENISINEQANQSHRNNLNRSLIIDAWSQFEFCITTICEVILSEKEKEDLKQEKFNFIVKTIKEVSIPNPLLAKLNKKFTDDHLTHVSTIRKCDKLFKLCKNYRRDIVKDKEFLHFVGRLRNTMHSFYIFYGNDFQYTFNQVPTLFRNGQHLHHTEPVGLKFHFDIAIELKEIFTCLIASINYPDKIIYSLMDES